MRRGWGVCSLLLYLKILIGAYRGFVISRKQLCKTKILIINHNNNVFIIMMFSENFAKRRTQTSDKYWFAKG